MFRIRVGYVLQRAFDLVEVVVAGMQVDHGRRLENGHIVVVQPLAADILDGAQVVAAVFNEELGQDEPGEDGGIGPVCLGQAAQLLGGAYPDEDEGEVEVRLRPGRTDPFQGVGEHLLRLGHRVGPDGILQTEGQGKRPGVVLVF